MKNSSNKFRGKNNKEYKKNSDFGYYSKNTNRSEKNNRFLNNSAKNKKVENLKKNDENNKYGKKLVLKEGLYRLARLATKKTTSINIIPIGIAYSKIPPNFRGEFCLSFGKPIPINDYLNFTIKDFNKFLNEKMTQEEEKALKNVGR